MSSIITSIKDLIASFFELIFSVFRTAFDAVFGLLHACFDLVVGTMRMVLHTIGDTLEALGGIGKFIASESSVPEWSKFWNVTNHCYIRQCHRHRTDCWWRVRLFAISTSPRTHCQSWRQEIELGLKL